MLIFAYVYQIRRNFSSELEKNNRQQIIFVLSVPNEMLLIRDDEFKTLWSSE